MEQSVKPKPLRKLIRERVFDSDDLQLVCAERNLRVLLAVWLAVRILTSVALLIFTQDWFQLLAVAICFIFAKILYFNKGAAILALCGGLATIWQVFYYGFFDEAARYHSPLLFPLAVLLLFTGVLQTAIMGYILAGKRFPPYYAFVRKVREDWIVQAQEYTRQQRTR